RRGRPPLHKQYDQGTAVLVAIALMNAAYGLVLKSVERRIDKSSEVCREFIKCIGPQGMLGGQAMDLATRGTVIDSDRFEGLEAFRNRKTSALIKLSLRVGAVLTGADARQLETLSRFAELVGNAYQMRDDLVDQ